MTSAQKKAHAKNGTTPAPAPAPAGRKPKFQSANGKIKIHSAVGLGRFREMTGRLPHAFESMEYFGLDLAAMQSDRTGGDPSKELDISRWMDLVVEVNGRNSSKSKEYFPIRYADNDVNVTDWKGESITLNGLEAALARFAYAANSICWLGYAGETDWDNMNKKNPSLAARCKNGIVTCSAMSYFSGKEAANYYHMAMHAAGQLGNCSGMFSYLD